MKAIDLLEKLNKLNRIYGTMNAEIEAYDADIRVSIYKNWQKRKVKIQIELINQFKEDKIEELELKLKIQKMHCKIFHRQKFTIWFTSQWWR